MECMKKDKIHFEENLVQLRNELAQHYKNDSFLSCQTMGEVVEASLKMVGGM